MPQVLGEDSDSHSIGKSDPRTVTKPNWFSGDGVRMWLRCLNVTDRQTDRVTDRRHAIS